jgi:hypothetical protein
MTLVELLVALVLSVLILGMILPLFATLTHPTSHLEAASEPGWRRALQADLLEIISPAKSAVPVIDVLPASDTRAFPELIVHTFCRAGGAEGGAASRGPSLVRYTLEPEGPDGFALIRSSTGWHDVDTSRYVLSRGLKGWEVVLDPPNHSTPPPATQAGDGSVASNAQATGGLLRVTLRWEDHTVSGDLWVPRLAPDQPVSTDATVVPGAAAKPVEDHP